MKRFILISILAVASAFTITSCTEESVEPKSELDNGGGGVVDPIVK
jgi:hypothetical protein